MILRDVPEWTWVSYRGNPCFLKYKNAREAYLIDCNKKNYIASVEDYIEPIKVQSLIKMTQFFVSIKRHHVIIKY